jgi:type IV pilus assembly protein PilA
LLCSKQAGHAPQSHYKQSSGKGGESLGREVTRGFVIDHDQKSILGGSEMLKKFRKGNEKGFTLIELMIVIAIIGILAAIAIPQFSAYRVRSYNAASETDLRNATTAQEAYFVDASIYTTTTGTLIGSTYGLFLSNGVQFNIVSAGNQTYQMKAWHNSGDSSFIIRGPGGSVSRYQP